MKISSLVRRAGGRVALAIALVMVVGTTGCLPELKQPEVRLTGVRLGGIGLRGGLIYAQLNVVNPNRFALEADGIDYDLEIADSAEGGEWLELAEGRIEDDFRVDGRDSTVIEVPIEFSYDAVGGALRSILDRGTLNYRVSGRVAVETPVRTEVPYRKTGVVSLSGSR